ncbi:MAG: M50 family metallopeptidase [Patescibacteria group bacterium]|nr:M50 family metallopeptidase [Patescibacteria group bacterium]
MSFLIFIIILSFLVIIHELGHFLMAKKNGVKVEEFGFGLPPKIWGKKIGETLFSINLLPIGGFVKLYGEEYHEIENKNKKIIEKNAKKAFIYKKPWQKTIIILGGIIMNLIFGIIVFYFILWSNQFKSTPIPIILKNHQFSFGNPIKKVIIAKVNENSPASKSNIKEEDIVLKYKINNNSWKNVNSANQFIDIVKNSKGEKITFELKNNKNDEKKITEINPIYNEKLKRYIIGVNLADIVILEYKKPEEKIFSGFLHSYNLIDYNLKIFGYLFSSAIKEKNPENITQTLTGPVGIFAVIDDMVKKSKEKLIYNLLELSALISLSLAFMNILPFPALDGGRLVFVLYEWITGKNSNKNIEKYVNFFGFLTLIALAVIIAINDFIKFFK